MYFSSGRLSVAETTYWTGRQICRSNYKSIWRNNWFLCYSCITDKWTKFNTREIEHHQLFYSLTVNISRWPGVLARGRCSDRRRTPFRCVSAKTASAPSRCGARPRDRAADRLATGHRDGYRPSRRSGGVPEDVAACAHPDACLHRTIRHRLPPADGEQDPR
jgi:hypothetical protein